MTIHRDRFEIIQDLENAWEKIKSEYFEVISEDLHIKWHEKFIYSGDWNVFGLTANYQPIGDIYHHCKETAKILKKHKALVCNAGFSILKPNTIIRPHQGYTADVLRCHLGICIPAGDCHLKVGNETLMWEDGKTLIFDDTTLHSAWNKTNETRIIMLLDLNRQLLLSSNSK